MKTQQILLTFTLFLIGIGESSAQSSVNASGGEAVGSGGTVSFSVGQIDYKSNVGSNGSVSEGVQQPFEFFVTGISEDFISFEVNLYPNPSSNFINLSIPGWTSAQNISYQLVDLNGKVLVMQSVEFSTTQIDIQNLADANYFLNILVEGEFAKTFKLVKTN